MKPAVIILFFLATIIEPVLSVPAQELNRETIISKIPANTGDPRKGMDDVHLQDATKTLNQIEAQFAGTSKIKTDDPPWSVELLLYRLGISVSQLRNTKKWNDGCEIWVKAYNVIGSKLPENTGTKDELSSPSFEDGIQELSDLREGALNGSFASFDLKVIHIESSLNKHEKSLGGIKSKRVAALLEETAALNNAYGPAAKAYKKRREELNNNREYNLLRSKQRELEGKAKLAGGSNPGTACYKLTKGPEYELICNLHKQSEEYKEKVIEFERKFLNIKK